MGGGGDINMPDHNAGLAAMANASMMSSLFQSNAMVATSGLQSATQMYQANIMYLVQHEKTQADLSIAHEKFDYLEYKEQLQHNENVRRIYVDYLKVKADAGEELPDIAPESWNTYNPNSNPGGSSGYTPLPPADTGLGEALDTVEGIVAEGTEDAPDDIIQDYNHDTTTTTTTTTDANGNPTTTTTTEETEGLS